MKKWPFFLGITLLLIIGIFICALLGRAVGIQGPALPISVVWPATGLSLAALLLFGYWAGIGVFLGNLLYNILFLTAPSSPLTSLQTELLAVIISLGSLAQALVSTYIIRTYSTALVFRNVKDILVFLLPAGLLSCLIGCTVGVTALTLAGGLDRSLVLPVWLTFWLGDTVGLYVITPLILIWILQRQEVKFSDHIPSIICMALLFILFASGMYFSGSSLPHLFVPISIWAAYLFRMHGASLTIFLMSTASIALAIYLGYEGTSLISLITFIGVIIAASLIIAAVVNERAQAEALLDSRNIYLEREVDVKMEILEQVKARLLQQQNLIVQASSSKLLVPEIQSFLNNIALTTNTSQNSLNEIQTFLAEHGRLSQAEVQIISEKLQLISQELSSINDVRQQIANIIENL